MNFPDVSPSAKVHSLWQNASVSSYNFYNFHESWNDFLHKNVFFRASWWDLPSKTWSFHRSSEFFFHGFNENFQLSVIPSTGFRQLPSTSGYFRKASVHVCISYHELQALPPWGRGGRAFPSIYPGSSDAQKRTLQWSDFWCPVYHNIEGSKRENTYSGFSPTRIQNARFPLSRHVRHRLLTSQVGMVSLVLAPCLSSWPPRWLLYYLYSLLRLYRWSSLWYSYNMILYVRSSPSVTSRRQLHRFWNGLRFWKLLNSISILLSSSCSKPYRVREGWQCWITYLLCTRRRPGESKHTHIDRYSAAYQVPGSR